MPVWYPQEAFRAGSFAIPADCNSAPTGLKGRCDNQCYDSARRDAALQVRILLRPSAASIPFQACFAPARWMDLI